MTFAGFHAHGSLGTVWKALNLIAENAGSVTRKNKLRSAKTSANGLMARSFCPTYPAPTPLAANQSPAPPRFQAHFVRASVRVNSKLLILFELASCVGKGYLRAR